jgi:hypothetical protein
MARSPLPTLSSTATIEQAIVVEVARDGYHPRTSKHSDTQSLIIIRDLLGLCPKMAGRASTGELVAKLRHSQRVGHDDWIIDIALGTCAGVPVPPTPPMPIVFTQPAIIQVALELKSIWTEHGKARMNRLRDFNSFHGYAHQYSPDTVAGAFLVVNAAQCFLSPLNVGKTNRAELTTHPAPMDNYVKLTIDRFRSIHLRNSPQDVPGLEALGVVVVEHDNIVLHPNPAKYAAQHRPTAAVTRVPPALRTGDPLHYHSFIQRICNQYSARF